MLSFCEKYTRKILSLCARVVGGNVLGKNAIIVANFFGAVDYIVLRKIRLCINAFKIFKFYDKDYGKTNVQVYNTGQLSNIYGYSPPATSFLNEET